MMCSHMSWSIRCLHASIRLGEGAGRRTTVGLVRQRFFTPRLRFKTYDEMNAWLTDKCIAHARRNRHRN